MAPAHPKTLRIGVMLEAIQLSDILGIDILGNLSKEYLAQAKDLNPGLAALLDDRAMDIEFFYMATTLEPAVMTPGLRFLPTVTYDDCPRDLDMVVIGGPLPSHRPEQAARFIREAWGTTRVWLSTCVGSMWLASAGVLEGLECTTNRGALDLAKEMHPGVKWLDQRWVVEEKPFEGEGKGELWTAGGAGAGKFVCALACLTMGAVLKMIADEVFV
jgi:transcriptional regulator GlxA family with amidase domain